MDIGCTGAIEDRATIGGNIAKKCNVVQGRGAVLEISDRTTISIGCISIKSDICQGRMRHLPR